MIHTTTTPRFNPIALSGASALQDSFSSLNQTHRHMATAKRINRGADDPAGVIIAARLASEQAASTARARGFDRAVLNGNIRDGELAANNERLHNLNTATVAAADSFSGVDQAMLRRIAPDGFAPPHVAITQDMATDSLDANAMARAENGAQQQQYESMARVEETQAINTAAALSQVQDTDYAKATSDAARDSVLSRASLLTMKAGFAAQTRSLDLLA